MSRRWRLAVALLALTALVGVPALAQSPPSTAPAMPKRLRIALVPLDDRPVCLQYPQMMAGLAYAEVVAPPLEALGRFTTPGDPEAVTRWLRAQDWSRIDALIVSTDMLAYGGLVASRVHGVDQKRALARLQLLEELGKAHPRLPIYGFSTIMRLAPTADGRNEAHRESLARWAEISADPRTPAERTEVADLESAIPPSALADYRRARARNRAVNLAAVGLVGSKVIDFLVVSQDDAKPRGVHLADRQAVTRAASERDLVGRVGVQPGADEVAMLLLARAVLTARQLQVTMRVTYSSERARTMVAPFEDRQLHETVSFQLVAAGAGEARMDGPTDLHLFVFASRHEAGRPDRFAADVVTAIAAGHRVVVADVDPRGDLQGGSAAFTEPLLAANVFPKLSGYASWNTAGNTLGTAIPHGLLAAAGTWLAARCASPAWTGIADAQATFMLHRLVNDYAYQGVLRPQVTAELRQANRTPLWLADNVTEVALRIQQALAPKLAAYAAPFISGPYALRSSGTPAVITVQLGAPHDLRVTLPWARTFEAAITFDVPVSPAVTDASRLRDRYGAQAERRPYPTNPLPACAPTPP